MLFNCRPKLPPSPWLPREIDQFLRFQLYIFVRKESLAFLYLSLLESLSITNNNNNASKQILATILIIKVQIFILLKKSKKKEEENLQW